MIEYLGSEGGKRNGSPVRLFTVTWEAVIPGKNFVEAARKALEEQRNPDGSAVCFVVTRNDTQESKMVDFKVDESLENPDEPDES